MTSKISNKIGSPLSNTMIPEMLEQSVVLIKPGFTKFPNIETMITNKILSLEGVKLVSRTSGKMTKGQAKMFYIDKKNKSYYDELTDYMSSSEIIAYVFESKDAISKVRKAVEELRISLKDYFDIPNDVMKNILHATNTKLVNNELSNVDMLRETKIINEIKGEHKRYVK